MAEVPSYEEAKARMLEYIQTVAEEIGSTTWKTLGRKLNVTEAAIENIDEECRSVVEKAYQLLLKWYQERGQARATKEVLCKALVAVKKVSIAEKLGYIPDDGDDGNSEPLSSCLQSEIVSRTCRCSSRDAIAQQQKATRNKEQSCMENLSCTSTHGKSLPAETRLDQGFEKIERELDSMLKYCLQNIPHCDRRSLGELLKFLEYSHAMNEINMDRTHSWEENNEDDADIAKIKRARRIRYKQTKQTILFLNHLIMTAGNRTRPVCPILRRRTSEVHLEELPSPCLQSEIVSHTCRCPSREAIAQQQKTTSNKQQSCMECLSCTLTHSKSLSAETGLDQEFEKIERELDSMLEYCLKNIPHCDRRSLGHLLKTLEHNHAMNEIIMDRTHSWEENSKEEADIAEIKKARTTRYKQTKQTILFLNHLIMTAGNRTRPVSQILPRCTSEVDLERKSVSFGAKSDTASLLSGLRARLKIPSIKKSTHQPNDTKTEDEGLLLRCPSCESCLNFEVEICLRKNQEIIVEENSASDCAEETIHKVC